MVADNAFVPSPHVDRSLGPIQLKDRKENVQRQNDSIRKVNTSVQDAHCVTIDVRCKLRIHTVNKTTVSICKISVWAGQRLQSLAIHSPNANGRR